MGSQSIRERVVDRNESWGGKRRAKRWDWLVREFPDLDRMSVIDLGGDAGTWTQSPLHPKHVHVVNIDTPPDEVPDWITVDNGDACALPAEIVSRRYDLVFSNSVIEHVGGHERRLRFAESVHTLAPAHWVQTPYRYFPVEPHWIAPGMQFFPVRARAAFARRWPLAHVRSADLRDALTGVLWTELLDRSQMRYYFPDSAIQGERLAGFTKSLIAVKKA
ncbi:class I SAM-dependent methyltransferase [Actinoplanes sp. NPDC049596]|uniref:methyltransferase domain-containing protein n=1 Tax=unclassified Actinoplanes TaxID=2626549 RepID=UPI00341C03AC